MPVAQARGGEQAPRSVENAHQVALGDAAGCGVLGMHRDRLTALTLVARNVAVIE